MGRMLYIVARKRPLLCGYLMTRVGPVTADGHAVEIKLDERRGERRRAAQARDPERRTGERRRRPSLQGDFDARGYARVVQLDAGSSTTYRPDMEPAVAWRRRSTWRQRAIRPGRSRRRWAVIAVALLVALGGSILVARSRAPQPAAPVEQPLPPASLPSKAKMVAPAAPAPSTPAAAKPAPSKPAPARIVTTRISGVVLSASSSARTLVLEDRDAEVGRRRVEVAPDARVVLSERDAAPEDSSYPFKDTAIDLSEVRAGDFVVVQLRGPEGKELARSVLVTFRPK